MSQLTTLVLVILAIAAVLGATWLLNRPIAPRAKPAADDAHDAHPFTVFGHAPLFYVALVGVLAATWFIGPHFFSMVNIWLKMGIALVALLLVWPPVWLKIQKVWASLTGGHFQEHVSHGDDEQDTGGKILAWTFGLWLISTTVSLVDHCSSGAQCSVGQNFWAQVVLASEHFAFAPATWTFIMVLAWHSRVTENRFWGYIIFGLWCFFGASYVVGGWHGQPFTGYVRGGNIAPDWLLWLFPMTR